MRANGVLEHPAGLGRTDHVCWIYANEREFAAAARRFLADGAEQGHRLLAVGSPAVSAVLEDRAPLVGVHGLLARGALELMTVGDAYGATAGLVPEQQLDFYQQATRRAVAAGYPGLRVVAELTALAAHPEWLTALMRWEHLADDFMAGGSGMSALCAYRRSRLADEIVGTVAAVHPLVHPDNGPPPFRLFFDSSGALVLAGTVDSFVADRLARVLSTTHLQSGEVRLDVSRLEFIDTRGCWVLAAWGRRLGEDEARLVLTGASRIFRRVWQVLGFDALPNVTVEPDDIATDPS